MSDSLARSASTGRRVLILSASAGAGHTRAGDALLAEFRRRAVACAHWDILDYATPALKYAFSRGYVQIIDQAPSLWKYLYERADRPWKSSLARHVEMLNTLRLSGAINEWKPTIIVCTHFTAASLVAALYAQNKVPCKPVVVVTDFDVHALWLVHSYQRYFVALDESRAYLEKIGISPARITVSGIPVDPVFRIPKDPRQTRLAFGLDPGLPMILISAGGFGVGPMDLLLAELRTMKTPAQIVAIAGKSLELKAKLDLLAKHAPPDAAVKIHPLGFTRQMDDYMAAADLLISKPGGMTTSEAMARGLPMCVVNPIPGQEERNSDHLLEAGAAIKCNNLPTLGWKVERLLRDPALLQGLRTHARAFGKPFAGETIVRELLD